MEGEAKIHAPVLLKNFPLAGIKQLLGNPRDLFFGKSPQRQRDHLTAQAHPGRRPGLEENILASLFDHFLKTDFKRNARIHKILSGWPR